MTSPAEQRYDKATHAFAVLSDNHYRVLSVSGPDTLDFLHRLTATDIKGPGYGSALHTLFLRGDGRLAAECVALILQPDRALLIAAEPFASPLYELLDRFLFTEKVELRFEDGLQVIEVVGHLPEASFGTLGLLAPAPSKTATASDITAADVAFANGSRRIIFIAAEPVIGKVRHQLYETARTSGGVIGGPELFEELRIREGRPAPGFELTENTIPLDANLRSAISFTKGCFPGQEVMARIDTLGHPANILRQVHFENVAHSLNGAVIELEGKAVGRLTSHATRSDDSRSIGLCYIKWAYRDTPQALTLRHEDHPAIQAHLILSPADSDNVGH